MLLVGSFVPPFVSTDSDSNTPTLENPVEIHSRYRQVHIKLEQIWLFNDVTEEIVAKIAPPV